MLVFLQNNILFKAKHPSRFFTSIADPKIPSLGASSYGPDTKGHSSLSAASELATIVSTLVKSSLQPSFIPTYKRAWKLFFLFLHATLPGVPGTLPVPPPTLALFIAYMFDHKYAPSTVNTYVSALGYCHKLAGFFDPTKICFNIQMLKGYGKIGSRLDSRLPITLPLLQRIVMSAIQLSDSHYNICQFRAMCSLAFFAFLRVGEITASASGHTLHINQLTKLVNHKQESVALKVTFFNPKHNYNQRPFSLGISRQNICCPVQLILEFLHLRGNKPGPLLLCGMVALCQDLFFSEKFSICIKYCGLDPSRYKGHSFRIGAASHAAEGGMSDAQIRTLGCRKSNAFLKYIFLFRKHNFQ